MHHEAVFGGVSAINRPVLPIGLLHAQLIETIAWVGDDAASMIAILDRFPELDTVDHRDSLALAVRAHWSSR